MTYKAYAVHNGSTELVAIEADKIIIVLADGKTVTLDLNPSEAMQANSELPLFAGDETLPVSAFTVMPGACNYLRIGVQLLDVSYSETD